MRGRRRQHGAAVRPAQHAAALELVEVAARGHRRDARSAPRPRRRVDRPRAAQRLGDLAPARLGEQRSARLLIVSVRFRSLSVVSRHDATPVNDQTTRRLVCQAEPTPSTSTTALTAARLSVLISFGRNRRRDHVDRPQTVSQSCGERRERRRAAVVELRDASEVLRRRPRAARRQPDAARRRGARADGRERRRQVDARQGPRRRRPARRRRHARRRRARSTSTRPHDARDAGIAVIYQEPTLFPDLSVAENVVMGYHPLGALRRIDRGAMHAQRAGPARPPRRAARPRAPGARPLDRRPADRRDRQGAQLRRARADHGRADRRALRARRSSGSSPSSGRCARRAPRCSSSRTASTRSSRSATPSR